MRLPGAGAAARAGAESGAGIVAMEEEAGAIAGEGAGAEGRAGTVRIEAVEVWEK